MTALHLLAANDDPTTRAGRAHLEAALARRPRATTPAACVLGAAHGDEARRLRHMVRGLEKLLGGEVQAPRLTDGGLDVAAARKAITGADVLYLDGGDTVALVEAVRARGLGDALEAASRSARVVYGLSAGACAASAFTIGYEDDGAPRVVPCLALGVPWPADVHDEEDEWPEMRALLELRPPRERGLCVPTHAAVLLDGKDAWSLAGTAELRWLEEEGRWGVEPLPSSPPRR